MIEAAQRAGRHALAQEIVETFAGFGKGIVAPWTLALLARGRALIADDPKMPLRRMRKLWRITRTATDASKRLAPASSMASSCDG
jgi:hypothetical protein